MKMSIPPPDSGPGGSGPANNPPMLPGTPAASHVPPEFKPPAILGEEAALASITGAEALEEELTAGQPARASVDGHKKLSGDDGETRGERARVWTERLLIPVATLLGALVSITTILTQIPDVGKIAGSFPGVAAIGGLYNTIAPWLYIWRGFLTPALVILALGTFIWAVRGRHRIRVFWRFAAAAVMVILVLAIATIRPSERVVGILPYAPSGDSQVDPNLGQELADSLRASLNRSGGLIKAIGVSRVPGESLADAGKRINANVIVDGSYSLGSRGLQIQASLFDVEAGESFGTNDVRSILRDDVDNAQQDVADDLADQIDVASATTRRAIASSIDCTTAYECYVMGRRYYLWFNEDGYNRAVAHYDAAISYDSQYARAYAGRAEAKLLLSELYSSEGKRKEANDLWQQASKDSELAVQYGPNVVESHRARAWTYRWQGLRDAARQEYDQIARISPPAPDFVLTATTTITSIHPSGDAETLWLQGGDTYDVNAQIALYREAIKLKPDLPQVHNDLGISLFAEGKLSEASSEFRQALLINPNMVYAHVSLAELELVEALQMRQAQGNVPITATQTLTQSSAVDTLLLDARQHVDAALSQIPQLASAGLLKGSILAAQGALEPAIKTSRASLATNPEAGAWYNQATYDDPAMYTLYISTTRQAISALPEYVYNYNALGNFYMEQGHYFEALKAYSDAVTLDPHFGVAWLNLSYAHDYLSGYDTTAHEHRDASVYAARKAVSETTNWPTANSWLGIMLMTQASSRRNELYSGASDIASPTPVSTDPAVAALPTPLATPPLPEGCAPQAAKPQFDADAALEESRQLLAKALEIDSNDYLARVTLGRVLYNQGKLAELAGKKDVAKAKYDEARKQIEAVAPEVNDFNADIHYVLGMLYVHENNSDQASKEFEQAFRINPDYDYVYSTYLEFLKQRKSPAADTLQARRLQLYAEQVLDHPRSPAYHSGMAGLYSSAAMYTEAENEYKAALLLDPQSPDLNNALGLFYSDQNEDSKSLDQYTKAAQLAPGEKIYKGNMGYAEKKLGDAAADSNQPDEAARHYQNALADYRAAVDIDPTADYHTDIGDVYLAEKKYDDAAHEYSLASSDQDYAYERLGLAYENLGADSYDKALAAYKQAMCYAPSDTAYYEDVVGILRDQQKYDDAVKWTQTALSIEPRSARLHNLLGLVYDSLDRAKDALNEYRLATLLDPSFPTYHYNLGLSYYNDSEYDKAVVEFQAAYDKSSDDNTSRWSYAYYLGLSEIKLQKWDDARKALENADRLNPNQPKVLAWLAYSYHELNDSRACATMAKAAQLAQQSTDTDIQQSAKDYLAQMSDWKCPTQ